MDHDDAASLLGAYAVHALDANENCQVTAHLATCVRCQAEASQYARILSLLGDIETPDGT